MSETNKIGQSPERPFRICANLNSRSFGDFINGLLFTNTMANHFDNHQTTIVYKNDAEFKRDLVKFVPGANIIAIDENSILPSLEMLNASAPVLWDQSFEEWFKLGLNQQDLLLTETMAAPPLLYRFDRIAHLEIPADISNSCKDMLISRGISPDRWFCCVFCREPGYKYKPGGKNFRDADPSVFIAATKHIIEQLGGQVVRLGHPQMTKFPDFDNFVDLSRDDDSHVLQSFAVSRSRFLLSTPSGPGAIAYAFDVPTAYANAVDMWCSSPKIIHRTVDVITPDGAVINQQEYKKRGLSKLKLLNLLNEKSDYRVVQNSADIVKLLADAIFQSTKETLGWRTNTLGAEIFRPNQFVWPPNMELTTRFL